MVRCTRTLVVVAVAALVSGGGTTVAGAAAATEPLPGAVPQLTWAACGMTEPATAAGVQCATADLPMDHDQPEGARVQIALARVPATDQANRIGSLFVNPGGPGGEYVTRLQQAGADRFAGLNPRFDIVAFAPRGVAPSTPAIDCQVDPETGGPVVTPTPTPLDVDLDALVARAERYVDACLATNGPILEHLSTANVARDLDLLRAAVGDEQLSYLGFSYGTAIGATYASLFPDGYRALVLDAAVDAEGYVNDPLSFTAEQAGGFEIALARFTEACAVDQVACSGFGGTDPYLAYDQLLAGAEARPVPADAYPADPRPVTADDIRLVTARLLYAKQLWGLLGLVLSEAANGDASFIRALIDQVFLADSTPGDRQFAISASEQHYPQDDLQVYLDRGAEAWASFPHFGGNSGYTEIHYALWPVRDEDAFAGPFEASGSAPAPLVIGTTYDPATPYAWAERLADDLGTARLLTMEGDGHAAYGGASACIDRSTEAYLVDGNLPAAGTVCRQETVFAAPVPAPTGAAAATQVLSALLLP
ncbi:TAP-like protein [Geodermatophilus africanus]|uniref:TAP-like protein n=1 Tax=Geodermatophilus africanus TaxID=1137993 RepID=A0A1H3LFT6_9ACTN|nr:alpha/beta hydrolase [Geodermatophilus africanus]SDY63029.1 TAP-like protein [Geodermatophilus africanus]